MVSMFLLTRSNFNSPFVLETEFKGGSGGFAASAVFAQHNEAEATRMAAIRMMSTSEFFID